MKRTIAVLASMALALMVLPAAAAEKAPDKTQAAKAPESIVYDAKSAFEFLSTLAGNWERTGGDDHDHGVTSRKINFRVSGAGSAVVETIYPGEEMEMVSVYHMDGDKLLLTHYCALGNAPIMKFEKSDKPGDINFVFEGGTNFDPKADTHVHQGVMKIKDPNTVESTFTVFGEGKAGQTVKGVMKRTQK